MSSKYLGFPQNKQVGDLTNKEAASASKEKTKFSGITSQQWDDWSWHIRKRITTVAEMEEWIPLTVEEKRAIQFSQGRFHFAVTPYWASLMDANDFYCPIRRQAIPLDEEFKTSIHEMTDSLLPPACGPKNRLVQVGPRSMLFTLHSFCAVYCRFCPQRKIEGEKEPFTASFSQDEWREIQRYLKNQPEIQEVILSGGDPLLLNDALLFEVFTHLRQVETIKTLRLQTRMLSHLPQRITFSFVEMLKTFSPVYMILHLNHPKEITPEFSDACSLLIDQGVPLASETVLLHEINDKTQILSELFLSLYKLRIRPYRLVQSLPSQGTEHFRTTLSMGLRLMQSLRGGLQGLALPEYVVDTQGGKIPLGYESILSRNRKRVLLKNYEGKVYVYPEKVFAFPT